LEQLAISNWQLAKPGTPRRSRRMKKTRKDEPWRGQF
jgi:hypothetical protein